MSDRETRTIALGAPVVAHDETLSALTMRAPLGRDMVAAGNGKDPHWQARLAASACGVPPSVLLDMDALDFSAVMGALNDFLEASTAARSSIGSSTPAISGASTPS